MPTYDSVSGSVSTEDVLAQGEEDLGQVDRNPRVVRHRRVVQS